TYEMIRNATDPETGNLSFGTLDKMFNGSAKNPGVSDTARDILFGQTGRGAIGKTLRLLGTEENKTQMGRLFIAIRGPAAAVGLASGAAAALGGHVGTGVATDGAIVLAPYVFAHAL